MKLISLPRSLTLAAAAVVLGGASVAMATDVTPANASSSTTGIAGQILKPTVGQVVLEPEPVPPKPTTPTPAE